MSNTYRLVGTTDDVIDCERCGKSDLRMTVVLAWLDEDGNDVGERVYYGTSCAAKALAERGVRITAAALRSDAKTAETARQRAAADAAVWLGEMHLHLTGAVTPASFDSALIRYATANRVALDNNPTLSAAPLLRDAIARRQAAIAGAA